MSRPRARRGIRLGRSVFRLLRRSPLPVRVAATAVLLLSLWAISNLAYQVAKKPTELFFPVADSLFKTPSETWREYGPLFREHSTETITPQLLAALAQVEGRGNPIARTYWRWQPSLKSLAWYRPASSAVGMYQITDATYLEARRYCVHDHVVAAAGAWNDLDGCWFNGLYTRVVPGHAVEMTAALLDRQVSTLLARRRITRASLQQKQMLAAVIHLCGAGRADVFARRGFVASGLRCGDHGVRPYLVRVASAMREFDALSRER